MISNPQDIAPGNNPDQLTNEQVGDGYRLLTIEEIAARRLAVAAEDSQIEVWLQRCWDKDKWRGNDHKSTYRVPVSAGSFMPEPGAPVPTDAAIQEQAAAWQTVYDKLSSLPDFKESWQETDSGCAHALRTIDELVARAEKAKVELAEEKRSHQFSREWWATRSQTLSDWVRKHRDQLAPAFVTQYFSIVANGTPDIMDDQGIPCYERLLNEQRHRAEKAEQERDEALKAMHAMLKEGGQIVAERDQLRAEVEQFKANNRYMRGHTAGYQEAKAHYEAQLAAAQEDKERLDWVEANWPKHEVVICPVTEHVLWMDGESYRGKDLRAAIDVAKKEVQP